MSTEQYIDTKAALERMRGNQTLLKRMLDLLPGNLPIERLREEIASGDISSLTATVHSIKGVAANLSLTQAHSRAVETEALLRQGQLPVAELETLLGTLQSTLEAARQVAETL